MIGMTGGSRIGTVLGLIGGLVGVVVGALAIFAPNTLARLYMGGDGIQTGSSHSASNPKIPQPEASGEFTASGETLGEWTFKPNHCRSGERDGFFGVWLTNKEDKDHWVKVAKNPTNNQMVVTVKIPNTDKGKVFQECKVLNGSVVRTNTKVNTIWAVQGKLKIDCKDEFKGSANFEMCY